MPVEVPVQPNVVPVTVYVVVTVGVAVIVTVAAPVDHAYVVAPLAVNVADTPLHTVADVLVITGNGFTVIVPVVIPVQPEEVPVTVYVVVTVGVAVIVAVAAPVDHAYVVAPPALNVAD